MIAVPAVDLREGRCVQLVGGRPEAERISLPDPVEVARRWWETGFRDLHVVDLDAALGRGHNREVVEALCRATPATVQVGGGLRSDEAVARILDAGAERVVVGTRAVEDRAWLEALAARHPDRVVVAADIRDGRVLSKGWTEASTLEVESFVAGLDPLPLGGILCTDVGREGRMAGVDGPVMTAVVEATRHPVIASGGVGTLEDLDLLDRLGATAAVLGMALYTGALDAWEVARRFGGDGDDVEAGDTDDREAHDEEGGP